MTADMLRYLSLVFASVALVAGLIAAKRWYESTKVRADPGWDYAGTGGPIEPVIPQLRALDLEVANGKAIEQVARLNRDAAVWTTVAVIFSAASSIAGALSSF